MFPSCDSWWDASLSASASWRGRCAHADALDVFAVQPAVASVLADDRDGVSGGFRREQHRVEALSGLARFVGNDPVRLQGTGWMTGCGSPQIHEDQSIGISNVDILDEAALLARDRRRNGNGAHTREQQCKASFHLTLL